MNHPILATLVRPSPNDDGFWEGTVELDGQTVQLVLLDPHAASTKQLDIAARFVHELARFNDAARAALQKDHADHGATEQFLDHHQEFLGQARGRSALDRLVLAEVGLEPRDRDAIAVFDYTLPGGATNYVLAVRFDSHGRVYGIDMES